MPFREDSEVSYALGKKGSTRRTSLSLSLFLSVAVSLDFGLLRGGTSS